MVWRCSATQCGTRGVFKVSSPDPLRGAPSPHPWLWKQLYRSQSFAGRAAPDPPPAREVGVRITAPTHARVVPRAGSSHATLICPEACAPGARHITASDWGSKGRTPLAGGAGVAAHPAARRAGEPYEASQSTAHAKCAPHRQIVNGARTTSRAALDCPAPDPALAHRTPAPAPRRPARCITRPGDSARVPGQSGRPCRGRDPERARGS
jgi:hypothetical protein